MRSQQQTQSFPHPPHRVAAVIDCGSAGCIRGRLSGSPAVCLFDENGAHVIDRYGILADGAER